MMVIGVLVLCLAAFNFINLMSVRFAHRAHEMGMKKIMFYVTLLGLNQVYVKVRY